jgi:hypothetical protein
VPRRHAPACIVCGAIIREQVQRDLRSYMCLLASGCCLSRDIEYINRAHITPRTTQHIIPSTTNQILIFVAAPPFLRHEDENSAMLDENLQNCRFSNLVADGYASNCRFIEFSSMWRTGFSHLRGGS